MNGLYLITDETLTPYEKIEEYLTPALASSAKIVQFRDKNSNEKILLETSLKIKALCRKHGTLFIINDYVDLAKEIDADGVHIGRDDEEYEAARRVLGKKKIIGVTCYGDIFRAKELEHKGADYAAFGSFFASSTKPNAPVINIDVLKNAKKMLKIPICAIGGITAHNAPPLIEAGADMLAVISDVWKAENIAAQSAKFADFFDETL